MMTDAEIQKKGVEVLTSNLGLVEAERFINLILKDPLDYSVWRQDFFGSLDKETFLKESSRLWRERG